MNSRKPSLVFALVSGLGLTLALLWLLGGRLRPATAAPVLSPAEGPVLSRVEGPVLSRVEGPVLNSTRNAPAAELRVCASGCTYLSVQSAVDAANDGDVIQVAGGTYTEVHARPVPAGYPNPPTGGIITQVVYISKTVTVRGGYSEDFDDWDPAAYTTTLNAGGRGRVIFIGENITPVNFRPSWVHRFSAKMVHSQR